MDVMENIMEELALRNDEIKMKMLNMIRNFINEHGYSPTVREIAESLSIKSTSTVQGYLEMLVKDELITKINGSARTIKILKNY